MQSEGEGRKFVEGSPVDTIWGSCFTGLSYSDIKKLTPEHFETDANGRTWIKKKNQEHIH